MKRGEDSSKADAEESATRTRHNNSNNSNNNSSLNPENPGQPTKAEIARKAVKKAKYLGSKAFLNQIEVYRLVKEFFTAYVEKKAELTFGELLEELHKVYISPGLRTKVYNLIKTLEKIEYEDVAFSQEELKQMLEDFQKIVKMLVVEHKKRIPLLTRFANWLFRKNPQLEREYFSELPLTEDESQTNIGLRVLIERVYLALEEGKKRKAAKEYKKAHSLYEHLPEHRQKKYYFLLKNAYEAIINSK